MTTSEPSLLPPVPLAGNDSGPRQSRRGRRRAAFVAVVLIAVGAVGVTITRLAAHHRPTDPAAGQLSAPATATITRATVSTTNSLPGTLGYGPAHKIQAGADGLITWLSQTGSTITRGHTVYRVNDRPVPLFYGQIPLYRTLGTANLVGRDVRVVADNLRALGYDIGVQPNPGSVVTRPAAAPTTTPAPSAATPAPGTSGPTPSITPTAPRIRVTVRAGEGVLTPSLVAAIRRWQAHGGMPVTGRLAPGSIVVQPRAFRVSALAAEVGDPDSGEVMSVTSTAKVITVAADEGDAASIEPNDRATVGLPDSRSTPAHVTAVGTALQPDQSDPAAPPKLIITVVLDHPSVLKNVNSGDLSVSFASETHKHVLTVPVEALLALSEGGYAVQVPGGRLIGVQTGIFAKGRVEISGEGLTEGLKVVTTS